MNAAAHLRLHRVLAWVWAANLPIVIPIATGWITAQQAFAYLAFVSIYALVASHWAAAEAIKSEVRVEEACEDG